MLHKERYSASISKYPSTLVGLRLILFWNKFIIWKLICRDMSKCAFQIFGGLPIVHYSFLNVNLAHIWHNLRTFYIVRLLVTNAPDCCLISTGSLRDITSKLLEQNISLSESPGLYPIFQCIHEQTYNQQSVAL